MTRRYNFERNLDARQSRRMHTEDRFLARQEKRDAAAEPMIGELCRNGNTVYYVYPASGRYHESANRFELVEFLKRNRYV